MNPKTLLTIIILLLILITAELGAITNLMLKFAWNLSTPLVEMGQ